MCRVFAWDDERECVIRSDDGGKTWRDASDDELDEAIGDDGPVDDDSRGIET